MRIKSIRSQYRRDFWADYECEGCGYVAEHQRGYDDKFFHTAVIPDMKCPQCGESANSLGTDYKPLTTKYPEGMQV